MTETREGTHLRLARRHVEQAEKRIEAQRRLLARIEARGEPTDTARAVLRTFERTLKNMREHLALEERENGILPRHEQDVDEQALSTPAHKD